jgi:4'-phosphopantetheinyl transferase
MNLRGESEPDGRGLAFPALLEWPSHADAPALAPDEVRVWLVDLDAGLAPGDNPETAEPGPELAILSEDERVRAARFVRARDRRRFARCRAALREILGHFLGKPAGSLRFRAAAVGKPELDREPGDDRLALRFNVSHSAHLALIAVGGGREIGVDIEEVRPIAESVRIVASFFTAAELAEFAAIADDAKLVAFHRGWTRKEAVLKGFGTGISGLSARHETGFGTTALTARFTPATPSARVDRWMLWEAAPRPGFVAALAVDAGSAQAGGNPPAADGSLPAVPGSP